MKRNSWVLENEAVASLSTTQLQDLLHCLEDTPLPYRYYLRLPQHYTFAPELEFQKANRFAIQTAFHSLSIPWDVSMDTSVCHKDPEDPNQLFENGDYGGEVRPRYLRDQKAYWEQLQTACLLLTKFGAVSSDLTSIHVNIGAHVFQGNPQLVENLLALWVAFEPEIFQFGMGEQLRLRPKAFAFSYPLTSLLLERYRETGSFLKSYQMALDSDDSKSIALNLFLSPQTDAQKFFVGNRIELRNFNGSLHPLTIQTDLLFSLSLVKYCVSEHFQPDLVSTYIQKLTHPYPMALYQDVTKRNVQKGLLLCDLLFDTTLDKLYFLHQWMRPTQRCSQQKKKSLVF